MPGRVHSREFKISVCEQVASGQKRPSQVCREHNLSESVLIRWRNEFKERGESAFTAKQEAEMSPTAALEKRIAELERHCGCLSLENDLLKKLVKASESLSHSGTT